MPIAPLLGGALGAAGGGQKGDQGAGQLSQSTTRSSEREEEREKTYATYIKLGPNGEFYIGRTSGYGTPEQIVKSRDSYHHMNLLDYGKAKLDRSWKGDEGYYAIRGREQMGIDAHGGVGSPNVGNSLNGIYIFNPRRELYLQKAYEKFGDWSK